MMCHIELVSDDRIEERMPSDLNDVHTSELYRPDTDIQLSAMSLTDVDNSAIIAELLPQTADAGQGTNCCSIPHTHACTHAHTHPFYGPLNFVWDYPGETVPELL